MYGYLRTHVPELKVRQQEYYRAVYCGLCRTMGQCTGQCSRMTLSYDFTLFALVRMALTGETVTVRSRRCIAHPLRKRPMADPNPTLRLCANTSAILAHHKVKYDLRDERGLLSSILSIFAQFGANILTIHQTVPTGGSASVSISAETGQLHGSVEMLLQELRQLSGVLDAHILAG